MFQTGISTFEKEPPQPVVYHPPPPPQPTTVEECNIIEHKQKPFWIPNWMNNNQINPNEVPNMMYFGTEGEDNPNVERYQRPCWNNRCILSIGIIFVFVGIAILICHFIEGCDLLVQCSSNTNSSSNSYSSSSSSYGSSSSSSNYSRHSSSSSLFNCL